MKDITIVLDRYREACRHLWNTYFYANDDMSSYSGQMLDQFEEIQELLFVTLVLEKVATASYADQFKKEALPFLRVVPTSEHGVPIMIERPSRDGNRYWDEPVNRVKPSDVTLHFIDYFDWNPYGHIDLKYYKVTIVAFLSHQDLVGREALIETTHARVILEGRKQ